MKGRGKGRKEGRWARHRVAVLGVHGCFALLLIVYCVCTPVFLFLWLEKRWAPAGLWIGRRVVSTLLHMLVESDKWKSEAQCTDHKPTLTSCVFGLCSSSGLKAEG